MEKMYIMLPHNDKGFFLVMESDDSPRINEFRALGFQLLPKKLLPFLQMDGEREKGFEFWADDQNLILEVSMMFANLMGLELGIESIFS